jgi:rhodanese-related sulfurtransferase
MKNLIAIIVILVILVAIGIFLKNRNSSTEDNKVSVKEANIQYVSMNDIEKIMNENENYIILDVRTIEEYNDGHIPGAICIPNETIDENVVSKLPDKEQLILIYCRSGNRSKQATKKLKDLGYLNLIEFGGIIDWPGEIEK